VFLISERSDVAFNFCVCFVLIALLLFQEKKEKSRMLKEIVFVVQNIVVLNRFFVRVVDFFFSLFVVFSC